MSIYRYKRNNIYLCTMELLGQLNNLSFDEVKSFLGGYNVNVKEDPKYTNLYLVTYDREKSDFTVPFVRQCRGTVLEKGTNKVVCYTFEKGVDFEFEKVDLHNKEAYLIANVSSGLINIIKNDDIKRNIQVRLLNGLLTVNPNIQIL